MSSSPPPTYEMVLEEDADALVDSMQAQLQLKSERDYVVRENVKANLGNGERGEILNASSHASLFPLASPISSTNLQINKQTNE